MEEENVIIVDIKDINKMILSEVVGYYLSLAYVEVSIYK